MSDRDERRARRANEQQPAIPDGGLNSAMPAWLTERPRWAETPTKEAPPPVKQLPPPDTSRIELSSILDVTDLPAWLQDVARRVERREAVRASNPVAEPALAVVEGQGDAGPVEPESHVLLKASQPEPRPELVVEELALAEPPVVIEDSDEGEPEPPEPVSEFGGDVEHLEAQPSDEDDAEQDLAADVGAGASGPERPSLDMARPHPAMADEEQDAAAGDPFARRATVKGQPVDWAAVRREAATAGDSETAPPSNPLLSQNPPVRIDPLVERPRSRRSKSSPDRPWWMSDPAIGVLLVAFILTMIYVILVASEVL